MSRLEAWERRSDVPLSAAALLFLLAYAVPVAWPGTPELVEQTCGWVVALTWAGFGVDYVVRVFLATDRRSFVRGHLLDLAVIALPLLRPLRLLRLVALLSVLNRAGARTLRGRVVTYVAGGTTLLVTVGALAVTDAERGAAGANIGSLGDGLWWAITTMTTVGYGDQFPVTTTGRVVAVGLMLGGIALLGIVTATLASWLVDRVSAETEQEQAATRAEVDALAAEIRALRAQLHEAGAISRAAQAPDADRVPMPSSDSDPSDEPNQASAQQL